MKQGFFGSCESVKCISCAGLLAAQLRRSGVGVDQAETHAHGGSGADIRAADG
jgi:hypothetical protein